MAEATRTKMNKVRPIFVFVLELWTSTAPRRAVIQAQMMVEGATPAVALRNTRYIPFAFCVAALACIAAFSISFANPFGTCAGFSNSSLADDATIAFSVAQYDALKIVTLVSATLSIFGSLFIILR
jgi:hypothetical protein